MTAGWANSAINGLVGITNSAVGLFGQSNTGAGVQGQSNSSYGAYGSSNTGIGVAAVSNSSYGLYGVSNSGIGVVAVSNTTYGIYVQSNTGSVATFANSSATHLVLNSNGTPSITSNNITLGSSLKAANGYSYLPNGLLLQWVSAGSSGTSANNVTITYPVPFPTAVLSMVGSVNGAGSVGIYTLQVATGNTTVAHATALSGNTYASGVGAFFQIIGY